MVWSVPLVNSWFVVVGVWPRLQSSLEKPHWIGIDFTHWEYMKESDDEEEEEAEEAGEGRAVDPEKKARIVRMVGQSVVMLCYGFGMQPLFVHSNILTAYSFQMHTFLCSITYHLGALDL